MKRTQQPSHSIPALPCNQAHEIALAAAFAAQLGDATSDTAQPSWRFVTLSVSSAVRKQSAPMHIWWCSVFL
jgi:hypothetical protein